MHGVRSLSPNLRARSHLSTFNSNNPVGVHLNLQNKLIMNLDQRGSLADDSHDDGTATG